MSKKHPTSENARRKVWESALDLDADRTEDAEAIDVLLAVAAYLADASYEDGHERRAFGRDDATRKAIARAREALYGHRSGHRWVAERKRLLSRIANAQGALTEETGASVTSGFVSRLRASLVRLDEKFRALDVRRMTLDLQRTREGELVSAESVAINWIHATGALGARDRSKAEIREFLRDAFGRRRKRAT